ncbi:MAG: hypothetical protein AB8B59_18525 [Maribacter sp.]
MKKALTPLLFLCSFITFGQIDTPEIFIDFGIYFEDEFEPKPRSYSNISIGVELFSYKFIAPEIEIAYFSGNDVSESFNLNIDNGTTNGWSLSRYMEASVITLSPKLFYGDKEFRFVLIPEYNIANIRTKGVYYEIPQENEIKYARTKNHYWSASFGIEGYAWSDSTRFGFYLNYSALDAGNALNQLSFDQRDFSPLNYNTKTLGMSLRLLYNFKRKVHL